MPSRYIPKPKTKIIKCVSCPNTIEVGWRTRKPWRCIHCGIRAAIEHNRQMHEKSGPSYEKWRARMAMWAAMQGTGTGDPSRLYSPACLALLHLSKARTMIGAGEGWPADVR